MMQIESQLSHLRLHGMSRSWQALTETRRQHELTLSEGLELLLQAEEQERTNNRFERLRKNARFRYQASIEELYLDASRGMDKGLITIPVSYTHLRAHETRHDLVCRLLLEKKKKKK